MMIRIILPAHLKTLARVGDEIALEVPAEATITVVLDALEARYPVLCGTIRDHTTHKRRPYVRFFACQEDWSNRAPETVLPDRVQSGAEPLLIVGAMSGG